MAATPVALHSDTVPVGRMVGENINLAAEVGLSSNSDVGGGKTTTTMKAAVDTAALTLHADVTGFKPGIKRSYDYGNYTAIMSDTNVQGVTTLAELVAITDAASNKRGPLALE